MQDLGKVLIVDPSRMFRIMLRAQLEPGCDAVLDAGTASEARERLDDRSGIGLVVCVEELPDGNGFDVLQHVQSLREPCPKFILVSEKLSESLAERACSLGATACLAKPTSYREIVRALREAAPAPLQPRASRQRVLGEALVLGSVGENGSGEPASQVRWELRDLSLSGAFFETKGPVQVGTEIDLLLVVGETRVRVQGVVMRLQEPTWAYPGGVGVAFRELRPHAEKAIRRIVAGETDS